MAAVNERAGLLEIMSVGRPESQYRFMNLGEKRHPTPMRAPVYRVFTQCLHEGYGNGLQVGFIACAAPEEAGHRRKRR
jgi:hypothetical protein